MQFTIYETMMSHFKKKWDKPKYDTHEMKLNLGAGLVSGVVAAMITNPLECITVNK